jgi:hypothetical protein
VEASWRGAGREKFGKCFFSLNPLQPLETPGNHQRKAWKNLQKPRKSLEKTRKSLEKACGLSGVISTCRPATGGAGDIWDFSGAPAAASRAL